MTLDKEQRRLYIQKPLDEVVDPEGTGKVKGLANATTVLLYPAPENGEVIYRDVLESLEVLKKDLEYRMRKQED